MRVTVLKTDRDLIEQVLQFANIHQIHSTKQVEKLFGELPFVGTYNPQTNQREFQVLDRSEVAVYRELQQTVRARLRKIASGNEQERRGVEDQVRKEMVPVTVVPSENGRPRFIYLFAGVEACCWYAIWTILDQSRGVRNRLGLCDAPGCERFNLTFTGRPRKYCNDKHRLTADLALRSGDRIKKWRNWVKDHGGQRKKT